MNDAEELAMIEEVEVVGVVAFVDDTLSVKVVPARPMESRYRPKAAPATRKTRRNAVATRPQRTTVCPHAFPLSVRHFLNRNH